MSKVIIEEEYAFIQKTGIGNYSQNLIQILKENNIKYKNFNKNFLKIFYNNSYLKQISYIIWFNIFLPMYLIFQKKGTILLCTNHFLPFFKIKKIRYIAVIHDLRLFKYPEEASFIGGLLFRLRLKNTVKKADTIITVSNVVKNEIIELFNYPADKIFIVYNSTTINDKTQDSNLILDKYNLDSKKYILSVSSLNKNKNIISLIKAFEKISDTFPDIKLVLVGGNGNTSLKTDNKNIIFTGYVSDEELPQLYSNALFYCSPSLYEGFGIPNIEAQSLGVPVLCSDIPVYRETMNNSAEFSKTDADSLAGKLEYLLTNNERREELVNLGNENYQLFLQQQISKQFINALKI